MWKLLHRLFGWDYVEIYHSYKLRVRRVRNSASGQKYVCCWFDRYFLDANGMMSKHEPTSKKDKTYTPLTWKIEKHPHKEG